MICLDTNAIIAVLNSPHSPVRMRIDATIGSGAVLAVPSIVLFELWYGAAKSARPERNARRITDFLTGPIEVLPCQKVGDAPGIALRPRALCGAVPEFEQDDGRHREYSTRSDRGIDPHSDRRMGAVEHSYDGVRIEADHSSKILWAGG